MIPIKENDVILGFWYDVLAIENNKKIHHVCPYSECKSYDDAINFYFKRFHNENKIPIHVQHHGHTKESLNISLQAC